LPVNLPFWYPAPFPLAPTVTVGGGSAVTVFAAVEAAAELVLDVAVPLFADLWLLCGWPPELEPVVLMGLVPLAAVAVDAPAPLPPTVTTIGFGLVCGAAEFPDRPINTPIPSASSSVPTPAMSVAPGDHRDPPGGRRSSAVAALEALCIGAAKRACPLRSPHSTQ
jgi:hypothetical protein